MVTLAPQYHDNEHICKPLWQTDSRWRPFIKVVQFVTETLTAFSVWFRTSLLTQQIPPVVTVYDSTIQWVQQCLISVHYVLPHKCKNDIFGLHFSLQCWFSVAFHWTPDTHHYFHLQCQFSFGSWFNSRYFVFIFTWTPIIAGSWLNSCLFSFAAPVLTGSWLNSRLF